MIQKRRLRLRIENFSVRGFQNCQKPLSVTLARRGSAMVKVLSGSTKRRRLRWPLLKYKYFTLGFKNGVNTMDTILTIYFFKKRYKSCENRILSIHEIGKYLSHRAGYIKQKGGKHDFENLQSH